MAIHLLHDQFTTMHGNLALGDRALVAIAAHVEVRSVLRASRELKAHGLDDVLIGSYARKVSNWPGKDVDVLGRLMAETVNTLSPDDAYDMFGRALQTFADQGRLVPQPRSFRIEFGPGRYPSSGFIRTAAQEYGWGAARVARAIAGLADLEFEFSVDVVPAAPWSDHYGIPETGLMAQTGQGYRTGRWRKTSPVKLTEETQTRNRQPQIAGIGAFVRTVKEIRQVKSHHLAGIKPSALYHEFILHEGFGGGAIDGGSWADLTASALSFIAGRLSDAHSRPVCDPILGTAYDPPPTAADLDEALKVFDELARRAQSAVITDSRCQAAIEWRYIFGGNGKLDQVFPLPPAAGQRVWPWARLPPTWLPEAPGSDRSVTADPPFDEAAEPDRLRGFIAALEADGFTRVHPAGWEGPTRQSLLNGGHTSSARMTIIIRPSWPYLPPLLDVPGIHAWHADQELLCIWQSEDNSQRWVTLQGLYERIDEWAAHATDGFALVENARNPEIYWQEDVGRVVGMVDLDELRVASTDGQHGEFHFTDALSADGRPSPVVAYDLRPGGFTATTDLPRNVPRQLPDGRPGHRVVRGRWFYRSSIPHPPRNLEELRTFLNDNQRLRLDKDLRDRPLLMFGLFWGNKAGLVGTVLLTTRRDDGNRTHELVVLRPKGRDALLLRAGPDAQILQEKTVAVLGVGAIGSHAAQQLARAGVARLRLIDHDLLWPVNLIRHAAPPGTPPGTPKATALREQLDLYPWIDVEEPQPPSGGIVWTPDSIERMLESADLTIDATGHGGLAELVGRVAHSMERPYITVALFQGGRVARVRRQAHPDDVPLLRRPHLDRYPEIPPLPEEVEYVGTEVGCLARVHNAPPISVIHAAALAVEAAIDNLTGRNEQPDEIIEVIRPGEAPFDQIGRLRREDLPFTIDMSETAQRVLRDAAHQALPNETGGVLLGCVIDERPVIAEVIEIKDPDATARCYTIPEGRVNDAVSEARAGDPRLGYLGEWHSHPSEAGPSPLDLATMLGAQDSGTSDPILVLVHPQTSDSPKVTAHLATPAGLIRAEICITGDLPATDLADAS